MKAIIIGGGIGGLSAALALRRRGIQSEVFEQAGELREVGAGLTVWANAIRALEQLGVTQRVLSLSSKSSPAPDGSFPQVHFLVWNESSEFQSAWSFTERTCFGNWPPGWKKTASIAAPGVSQLRAMPPECSLGSRTVGRRARMCGADGLHSVVRSQLHGISKPRYAGYTCWRGFAHLELKDPPPGLSIETWWPGARFSVHHCGPGRLFWYATQNVPEGGVNSPAGRKADVQAIFRPGTHRFLKSLQPRLKTTFCAMISLTALLWRTGVRAV